MDRKYIYSKPFQSDKLYSWIYEILPSEVRTFLQNANIEEKNSISEIHLRASGLSTITCCNKSIVITCPYKSEPLRLCSKDIEDFIYRMCKGSVYTHEESIANGFITVNGIRMGISGTVTLSSSKVTGFSDIKGVNIRLPVHIPGCADDLMTFFTEKDLEQSFGILVASAPGVGKTTVLRELAIKLSQGVKDKHGNTTLFRTCVIDERCELYIPSLFSNCCADIYCGIPKHTGIEFASRTMNPQIIIFDEIGSEKDASAVLSAHFGGVSFISSVHASSPATVTEKKALRELFSAGIFTHIYFLERTSDGIKGTLKEVQKC